MKSISSLNPLCSDYHMKMCQHTNVIGKISKDTQILNARNKVILKYHIYIVSLWAILEVSQTIQHGTEERQRNDELEESESKRSSIAEVLFWHLSGGSEKKP